MLERIQKNKFLIIFIGLSILFELFRSFFMPIYSVYYVDRGLSYSQVSTVKIFQILAMLIFEIPAGILADKIGRLKVFTLSAIVCGIAFTILSFSDDFILFSIAEFIYGLGFALNSGTLISDFNHRMEQQKINCNYGVLFGRFIMGMQITSILSGNIGNASYSLKINLPFIISSVGMIFIIPIVVIFVQKIFNIKDSYSNTPWKKSELSFAQLKENILNEKQIISFFVFSAIFTGVSQTIYQYWSILFIRELEITPFIVFTGMMIFSVFGGYITSYLSKKNYIFISRLLVSTLFLGGSLVFFFIIENKYILMLLFFVSQLGRGMMFSNISFLSNEVINKRTYKTTILSISGTIDQVSSIAGLAFFSIVTPIVGISMVWALVSVFYFFNYFLYITLNKKYIKKLK